MPSPSERTRNNVRTGVFVTATLILAFVVLVTISGQWDAMFRRKATYTVTYPIAEGISNLQSGSDVRVGGLTLGSVSGVEPDFTDDEIEVTFDLDHRAVVRPGARIYVSSSLIGSDAWIDITYLGEGEERVATIEGSTTS